MNKLRVLPNVSAQLEAHELNVVSEYLEDELVCGLVRMASARTASVLK